MAYTPEQLTKLEEKDVSKMRPIVRGEAGFPVLLYDLFSFGNQHPHEQPVRDIIIAYISQYTANYVTDSVGNLVVKIGESSPVLFSCHMDTVHRGMNTIHPMMQQKDGKDTGFVFGATYGDTIVNTLIGWEDTVTGVMYSTDLLDKVKTNGGYSRAWLSPVKSTVNNVTTTSQTDFRVYLEKEEDKTTYMWPNPIRKKFESSAVQKYSNSILGADDKLGCFLMCEMIRAGIAGTYIFHVGEECGGVGSGKIRAEYTTNPAISPLKGIQYAVAFDRKGYSDVIQQQGCSDTASKTYTDALAKALNEFMPPMQQFSTSTHGVFTDTKIYADVIPECTNISVGYNLAHGQWENFDLYWLMDNLLPAIVRVKWDTLPVSRDPSVKTSYTYGSWGKDDWGGDWYSRFSDDGKKEEEAEDDFEERYKGHTTASLNTITSDTPMHKVPNWKPEDGYLTGVAEPAMLRIIDKWELRNRRNTVCKAILKLLKENESLRADIAGLEEEIEAVYEADIHDDEDESPLLSRRVH